MSITTKLFIENNSCSFILTFRNLFHKLIYIPYSTNNFNMKEIKLSDDVIDQIKDFVYWKLTEEQKVLIDKLILNEELKGHYKRNGLCKKCKQPKTSYSWCQSCIFKYLQQNFKNGTSGNHSIDEFIQKAQLKAKSYKGILEWIEYNRFENVEYLAKGGFGTTYKATWKDGDIYGWDSENNQWERDGNCLVALKCLHNSQNITVEFLKEVESHYTVIGSDDIVRCYGITKDPETNYFMMVMDYIENGSLRQHLNNNFNSFDWKKKLLNLLQIAYGLREIHQNKLIHQDFHCGNILCDNHYFYITDLGLCRPANVKSSQSGNKKIYGVLPYVAPEVLRGKEYTQASDIYGFGIIAYEFCTGLPPYHDIAHDEFLAAKICQGLRPNSNYKIPQLISDIIKQCWDADPLKRPIAEELKDLLRDLYSDVDKDKENSIINKQIKEADKINDVYHQHGRANSFNKKLPFSSSTGILSYSTHTQAVYVSRLLDFKNLPEPKNANNDNSFEVEFSESTRIDFTKLNINSKDEATK